jgi:hypothetical protein
MLAITGRSSSPAAVRTYGAPPFPPRGRRTTPARSSTSSRCLSKDGEIPGTPRRISLKRVAPAHSSRTIRSIQRWASVSEARATGQNWP